MITITQLITNALTIINVTSDKEAPSDKDMTQARTVLNSILNSLEYEGVYLFKREWRTHNFTDTTGSFTLDPSLSSIEIALLQYQGQDSPLTQINTYSYADITDKSTKGVPQFVHIRTNPDLSHTVYVYPIPENNMYTLKYLSILKHDDYTDNNQVIRVPDRWELALTWLLVSELGPYHQVEKEKQYYFDRKAEKFLDKTKADTRERPKSFIIKSAY